MFRASIALTAEDKRMLETVGRVAREHQNALLSALSREERKTVAALLLRVASQQGLKPGVHPGFDRTQPSRSMAVPTRCISRDWDG